jgi:hypothetical protein
MMQSSISAEAVNELSLFSFKQYLKVNKKQMDLRFFFVLFMVPIFRSKLNFRMARKLVYTR